MTTGASVVWLRDDLRVADNPALRAAADRGLPFVVLYVLDDVSDGIRPLGGASRWWLHHSLAALRNQLDAIGGTLTVRRGAASEVLPTVIAEANADAVFWNRRYSNARQTDAALKTSLRAAGTEVHSFQAALLFEPWTVSTAEGNPYKVFTPFWRACLQRGVSRPPLEAPARIEGISLPNDELDLLPRDPDWAGGLRQMWQPGEAGAMERLEGFAADGLASYHLRDQPGIEATSHLSPHLRFGEISPFQIYHRVEHGQLKGAARANAAKFLSEVGWREFNANILFHFPSLATENFRSEFDAFRWGSDHNDVLQAWQQGRTGIPLVDAGMRELWHTGYMHNRVRMVAASFLIKNLLIDWRIGEQWFWDTLVDADDASNPGNWQWVAGSGADAAPYFRVFNPVLQQEKFDSRGEYVRRWVPEWGTPAYPEPIIDLKASRAAALEAYEAVKAAK
jgi:deoxyribodipyrimidine photo-lyase